MKEPTPEEVREAKEKMQEAKWLASELAEHTVSSTNSSRVGILSAGILFSSLAAMNGMSMHSAISLVMQIYKDVEKFEEANRETDE